MTASELNKKMLLKGIKLNTVYPPTTSIRISDQVLFSSALKWSRITNRALWFTFFECQMETGDKERAHAQAMKFPLEINSIFKIPISEKFPKWHTNRPLQERLLGPSQQIHLLPENWGRRRQRKRKAGRKSIINFWLRKVFITMLNTK